MTDDALAARYHLRLGIGGHTVLDGIAGPGALEDLIASQAKRARDAMRRGETVLVSVEDVISGERVTMGRAVIAKGGDDAA